MSQVDSLVDLGEGTGEPGSPDPTEHRHLVSGDNTKFFDPFAQIDESEVFLFRESLCITGTSTLSLLFNFFS